MSICISSLTIRIDSITVRIDSDEVSIDYVAPSRNRSALKLPRPDERPYARLASYWRGMRNPRTCS